MADPTEEVRRLLVAEINGNPQDRESLERFYGAGQVWDTAELTEAFTVEGFAAPFCFVTRKSDGKRGMIEFQHQPRFYYNFVEE